MIIYSFAPSSSILLVIFYSHALHFIDLLHAASIDPIVLVPHSPLLLAPSSFFPLFSPPLKELRVGWKVVTCCGLEPPTSCPAGSRESLQANAGTSLETLPPQSPAAGKHHTHSLAH